MKGTIAKKMTNGFGFISREGETTDLFFHSSSVVGMTFDDLKEGDTVTFEIENGREGKKAAVNVTRV